MKPYDSPDAALVAEFVTEQPLALLISHGSGRTDLTPLPLRPRLDTQGAVTTFEGHMARRNPQLAMLREDPRAMLVFQGPHRSIPTQAVANPSWVPTWNYLVAWFEVEILLVPDDTGASVDRLVEKLEPGGWTPQEKIPERHAGMMARIIGFEARVLRSKAKFKLGQDENGTDWQDIVAWLGDDPLASWMSRAKGRS